MSRYGRRLANKAHRLQIRQARQRKRTAAAEVRQTVGDYQVRESVRQELVARQEQPHSAIAGHMSVPRWVVDQECQNVGRANGALCPHPR